MEDDSKCSTLARINFEKRFARGGVGAIISSHVPVHIGGRILPNYAAIDCDDRIAFWEEVGKQVRQAGQEADGGECKYILQLSHSGRQQDIAGIENLGRKPRSSTNEPDAFNGIAGHAMSLTEIEDTIHLFAEGARRAQAAHLDGVELHSGNGYLFSQFLSSAINDRTDKYGGGLENRARFLLDVIRAVRARVGPDYFLMVKLSAVDHHNAATFPFEWKQGNTLEEGIRIARWVEEAGADAIHVSSGSMFPHPRNPAGDFPFNVAARTYESMLASGELTARNFFIFRHRWMRWLAYLLWRRTQEFIVGGKVKPKLVEGLNAADARAIKAAVKIPVICTGGFQTASRIREVLQNGSCDAVSIARPLLANLDLPQILRQQDRPDRPCTYCNKCLVNGLEHPLGCYEVSRYDGDYDRMMREVMSVFRDETPRSFPVGTLPVIPAPAVTQTAKRPEMLPPESGRWKAVFRVKALWNWAGSLIFLIAPLVSAGMADQLRVDTRPALMYAQLLLAHTFLFGIGFWLVSRDLARNHTIVRLGIVAQLAFGGLLMGHWLGGTIPFLLAAPGFIDFAFAMLFLAFLRRVRPLQPRAG